MNRMVLYTYVYMHRRRTQDYAKVIRVLKKEALLMSSSDEDNAEESDISDEEVDDPDSDDAETAGSITSQLRQLDIENIVSCNCITKC